MAALSGLQTSNLTWAEVALTQQTILLMFLAPAGHGSFDCKDCVPDTVNSAKSIRDLYEKAGASKGGEWVTE
jgi:hypothetical protein